MFSALDIFGFLEVVEITLLFLSYISLTRIKFGELVQGTRIVVVGDVEFINRPSPSMAMRMSKIVSHRVEESETTTRYVVTMRTIGMLCIIKMILQTSINRLLSNATASQRPQTMRLVRDRTIVEMHVWDRRRNQVGIVVERGFVVLDSVPPVENLPLSTFGFRKAIFPPSAPLRSANCFAKVRMKFPRKQCKQ